MTLCQRFCAAWRAFRYKRLLSLNQATKEAVSILGIVETHIRSLQCADITEEQIIMALADQINSIKASVVANTTAITNAVGNATAPLNTQITELQGEISVATSATTDLQTAVDAQTAALATPA